jgi:hypothetical protein
MTRFILTMAVPLVLPTALYVLWVAALGRGGGAAASGPTPAPPPWRGLPWPWLVGTGVALAAAALVAVVQTSGARDGRYVPPHEENGQIVPGHVEPDVR